MMPYKCDGSLSGSACFFLPKRALVKHASSYRSWWPDALCGKARALRDPTTGFLLPPVARLPTAEPALHTVPASTVLLLVNGVTTSLAFLVRRFSGRRSRSCWFIVAPARGAFVKLILGAFPRLISGDLDDIFRRAPRFGRRYEGDITACCRKAKGVPVDNL